GHKVGVVSRGAKLRARAVCRREVDELPEEVCDASEVRAAAYFRHMRPEPRILIAERIAFSRANRLPHKLPEHHEGGAGTHWVRLSEENRCFLAFPDLAHELVAQSRLSLPGRTGHD